MKNSLFEMNVLSESKLEYQQAIEKKDNQKASGILAFQSNMHLIEKLWHGIGKSVVSVPMGVD